jgi:PEP-CTERM motif
MFLKSAALLIAGCSVIAYAVPVDPYADFANSNPNGVWSYGYTNSLGSTFNLFTDFFTAPNPEASNQMAAWRESAVDPFLGVYQTFTPGVLLLHPGAAGQYSVLRFTAPSTQLYTFSGLFSGFDAATTDVHVLLNGGSLFDSTINGLGSTQSFLGLQSLTAGSTLDFVVGYGGNGDAFDSTGLNLQIEAVPEPGTIGLIATGLIGVFVSVRLRKPMR